MVLGNPKHTPVPIVLYTFQNSNITDVIVMGKTQHNFSFVRLNIHKRRLTYFDVLNNHCSQLHSISDARAKFIHAIV